MAAALEKKMLEVRKWEETTRKEMQQQIASQQQEQLKILEVSGWEKPLCLMRSTLDCDRNWSLPRLAIAFFFAAQTSVPYIINSFRVCRCSTHRYCRLRSSKFICSTSSRWSSRFPTALTFSLQTSAMLTLLGV